MGLKFSWREELSEAKNNKMLLWNTSGQSVIDCQMTDISILTNVIRETLREGKGEEREPRFIE